MLSASYLAVPGKQIVPDLVLRSVQSDEELHRATDLMAKCHEPVYFESMRWLQTFANGYPGFLREHTRIALSDGELAGALRLSTDTVRIGEARLKMGGFGWVTTDPRHRHKGVARELMCDTLRYMAQHHYHVSMLFGIPNFYHRFGFTSSLAEYSTSVDTFEASTARHNGYRVREAKPGDIPAIQKMHHAHDADVSCSLVRSRAHITNRWDRWKPVSVLTDENGKVIAYSLPRRSRDEFQVIEVGVAGPQACGALLHACSQAALEECAPRIIFMAPPCHPFVRYLLQFKSSHEMRIQRDEGGMMAFVDLGETLESMIPEWESTLMRNVARDHHVEVTLLVDRKPFRVRSHRGAVDVTPNSGANKVSLTEAELMHLITGYRYLEEILSRQRRILSPEARDLLAAMFPKRTAYVWRQDRF